MLIKNLVSQILFGKYTYITKLTKKHKLKSLLTQLYPICCDKNLIRMGPSGDGGYLVPDDLEGIDACFSPGVSLISGFEKECADKGMKVFLADRSVETPAESHDLFHFTKKFIGVTSNSHFMTMDDWVSSSLTDSESDLLLQMDIEGSEYEVILAASDLLMRRFRIIVVEFHSLIELWNRPFFKLVSRVFEKLLQTHTCVHNHPNNCGGSEKRGEIEIPKVTEMTFLRNDRINNSDFAKSFPHPLDSDNKENPPLPLPKCWYHGI